MKVKTKTVELPTFEQLTDEEKEKAIENWRYNETDYFWQEENKQSLDGFLEHFSFVTVKDWEYGFSQNYITFSINDDGIAELKGNRLFKYLVNNGYFKLTKQECPFTGYCMDDVLLGAIRQFCVEVDQWETMESLINSCLHRWIFACRDDIEYQNSDEYIAEHLICNEYTFNRDTLRIDS